MRKYLIYSTLATLGLIVIFLVYLSVYGIKTEKFNDLIRVKIKQFDPKLSLNINDVFLKLNVKEKSININIQNAKLYVDKKYINLSKIDLNLDVLKFLKKENSIKKIRILTKKNKIKKITDFLNLYKFNIPRQIIYNQIEDGNIKATIDINFNENVKRNFIIKVIAKISDGKLNVLNKIKVEDINFDFNIKDNKYIIKKANFNYEGIDFNSKEIIIKKLDDNYEIKGDLANKKGLIDPNYFSKIANFKLDFLDNKKIIAETNNEFKFKINSKKKIKELNLSSKINFKEIFVNKKIQNLIFLQNGSINTNYNKNNLKIDIDTGYSFIKDNYQNNEKDKIKVSIIKNKNENFRIEAFVKNENNSINSSELSNYFKYNNNIIKNQDLIFGSVNRIAFIIDDKDKVKNLTIKSKLSLEKIIINYKSSRLKNIFPNYKNIVKIKNNITDIDFSKNKTKIVTIGDYSFDNEYDKFNFEILKNKNKLNFNSKVEIDTNPILLKDINYKKKKDIFSEIEFNGQFFENKKIKFENINFFENQNKISLSNLYLTNNYKIIDFDKLQLEYLNDDKKFNQINILKKNNKFKLTSESFDGSSAIKNLLKANSKNNLLNRFKNLNSEIILDFDQFFIDDKDYLKKIRGNIVIEKNKIKFGNITARLNNKNDFNLNIKTNSKKEKITNLIIDNPEPFIKHYEFIKGFSEGNLSYNSIEKNGIRNSKLKIIDFKVKDMPVLAKLLALVPLGSFHGIIDLLTGEGIRFDELEMDYESSKNLTTIKEMYAIGPAISILMDGYIEKDKLISLRGTMVPATYINKIIGKIKVLGEILVGSKKGEGVFGVSFKIKGPPKDFKTTVNPVKTILPRFITRISDKLKK
tara:strand:+ start:2030 stop:4621 length:2592 start_codon:yes stop_codon:yes gene_type:complete